MNVYKRFGTLYRQHMITFQTEICAQLSHPDHPIFKLATSIASYGNFMDPCPITVRSNEIN